VTNAINAGSTVPSRATAIDTRPELRVLQVFHVLSVGGAEKWLVSLLEWFASNEQKLPVRLRFDVCLTGGKPSVFDERVMELGARLHYLRFSRHNLASFAHSFRALLAANSYDAIHDHADFAGGLHFLLAMGVLPRIRIIHVHNPVAPIDLTVGQHLVRSLGQYGVKRLASAVAGTSRVALEEAGYPLESNGRQVRIALHCGFDTQRFALSQSAERESLRQEFGWHSATRILLFVGRLESTFNQKNPEFALNVVKACIDADPTICALFIGAGGEMQASLSERVAAWGLRERILFLGIRHDVPRKMSGADLLLFPSVAEGLGMVAVEAQAAGLRVLASTSTPRECAVAPGMVMFRSLEDSPADWATSALRILDMPRPDPQEARFLVEESPFAIANSARTLLQLYSGRSARASG
jgi:glycosyltransferase involved in cell wall biosynthesis